MFELVAFRRPRDTSSAMTSVVAQLANRPSSAACSVFGHPSGEVKAGVRRRAVSNWLMR